eukprot:6429083-Amphidinium_carterae.1
MSSAQFTAYLYSLLAGLGLDLPEPFGSHSCKATLLSWAAKFDLPLHVRALLGGHVSASDVSILTYSRDELAGPLRQLGRVLEAVRSGTFDPDATRSGRFQQVQVLSPDSVDPNLPIADAAAPYPTDCQDDDGDASSSSSSASSENTDVNADEEPFAPQPSYAVHIVS